MPPIVPLQAPPPEDPFLPVADAVQALARRLGCPVRATVNIEREDGYRNCIHIGPESGYRVAWGSGSNPFLQPPPANQSRLPAHFVSRFTKK